MEIFRDPRVTLLARPEFVEPEHLKVQWKGEASGGERLAEYAGAEATDAVLTRGDAAKME